MDGVVELDNVIDRMIVEAERYDSNADLAKSGAQQVAALAESLRLDLIPLGLRLMQRVVADALTSDGSAGVSLGPPKNEDCQAFIRTANAVNQMA